MTKSGLVRKSYVILKHMEQLLDKNIWFLVLVALWTLPWKGVALWKAAQRGEKKWFIALLIVNTLAILEIYYIFVWTKRKQEERHEVFKGI